MVSFASRDVSRKKSEAEPKDSGFDEGGTSCSQMIAAVLDYPDGSSACRTTGDTRSKFCSAVNNSCRSQNTALLLESPAFPCVSGL
ncbi:unnamed protein product [Somion occarium]|uniref:Uncharacterized protein n=1 Tax=Somion occarium TaxID=3059160 RepID=A0ABP1CXL5_9APHY